MAQDALGNEVSGRNDATLRAIDDFVDGFLGYETRATNVLAAADADPESVLANVYAGFTWMFLEAATAEDHAQLYLARARAAAAAAANPRETLLVSQQAARAKAVVKASAIGSCGTSPTKPSTNAAPTSAIR